MPDPEWLEIARKEGRILSDTSAKMPMPEKGENRQRETAMPKKKRWSGRSGKTDGRSTWAVILYPACRVMSEANAREHWAAARRRKKQQAVATAVTFTTSPATGWDGKSAINAYYMPLTVTFTHIGPVMDDDNLQSSFKAIRDEIARLVGVDDGPDNGWTWKYDQRKGPKGVEIRIEPTQEPK